MRLPLRLRPFFFDRRAREDFDRRRVAIGPKRNTSPTAHRGYWRASQTHTTCGSGTHRALPALLIALLCSDAAGWITGQVYPVDGGYVSAL